MLTIKNLDIEVLQYLSTDTLYHTALCNKYFANILHDDEIWRRKLVYKEPDLIAYKAKTLSFRDYYKLLTVAPEICAICFSSTGLKQAKDLVEKHFRKGITVDDFHQVYVDFATIKGLESIEKINLKCWIIDTITTFIPDKLIFLNTVANNVVQYDQSLILLQALLKMGAKPDIECICYASLNIHRIQLLINYGIEIPPKIFAAQFARGQTRSVSEMIEKLQNLFLLGLVPDQNIFTYLYVWAYHLKTPETSLPIYQLLGDKGIWPIQQQVHILRQVLAFSTIVDFYKSHSN